MIFVVTGYHNLPFDRLIKRMDEIAGEISENIVIQKGPSSIATRNAVSFAWEPEEAMRRRFEEARLVIGHAGVGTILDAKRYGKPIIIVPRRKAYQEVFDDHQMEISQMLSEINQVQVVYDVRDIPEAIRLVRTPSWVQGEPRRRDLLHALRNVLAEVNGQKNQ